MAVRFWLTREEHETLATLGGLPDEAGVALANASERVRSKSRAPTELILEVRCNRWAARDLLRQSRILGLIGAESRIRMGLHTASRLSAD